MRVSEKGQITIPKNVRELAGIEPNSEVVVTYESGKVVISLKDAAGEAAAAARLDRFMDALKHLEGTGDATVSSADVMAMTRDRDI